MKSSEKGLACQGGFDFLLLSQPLLIKLIPEFEAKEQNTSFGLVKQNNKKNLLVLVNRGVDGEYK